MTERTNGKHPDYKLLGSTGEYVLKSSGVRPRRVERQTAKDVNNITLYLECLNLANRSMDDFDVDENFHSIATGGNSDDETLTNQHNQTQINILDTVDPSSNGGLNINAHSHIGTNSLLEMRTSKPNSNRASTPNDFLPDSYPQLTRFPLLNRFPQPRAIRPSNRFVLSGGRPPCPQHGVVIRKSEMMKAT